MDPLGPDQRAVLCAARGRLAEPADPGRQRAPGWAEWLAREARRRRREHPRSLARRLRRHPVDAEADEIYQNFIRESRRPGRPATWRSLAWVVAGWAQRFGTRSGRRAATSSSRSARTRAGRERVRRSSSTTTSLDYTVAQLVDQRRPPLGRRRDEGPGEGEPSSGDRAHAPRGRRRKPLAHAVDGGGAPRAQARLRLCVPRGRGLEWVWNVNPYHPIDNEAVIGIFAPTAPRNRSWTSSRSSPSSSTRRGALAFEAPGRLWLVLSIPPSRPAAPAGRRRCHEARRAPPGGALCGRPHSPLGAAAHAGAPSGCSPRSGALSRDAGRGRRAGAPPGLESRDPRPRDGCRGGGPLRPRHGVARGSRHPRRRAAGGLPRTHAVGCGMGRTSRGCCRRSSGAVRSPSR